MYRQLNDSGLFYLQKVKTFRLSDGVHELFRHWLHTVMFNITYNIAYPDIDK